MWKEKELMGSVLSGELEHSVLGPDWHGCGILLKGFLLDFFLQKTRPFTFPSLIIIYYLISVSLKIPSNIKYFVLLAPRCGAAKIDAGARL